MANTTWNQIVHDVADAYRLAVGNTDGVKVGELATKIAALKNSGQYMWGKYTVSTSSELNNPQFKLVTQNSSMAVGMRYDIVGIEEIFLENIDENFFDGCWYANSGRRGFELNNGKLEYYGNSNTVQFVSTYDQNTRQLVVTELNVTTMWNNVPCGYDGTKTVNMQYKGDYIESLVSDNPLDFPDKGIRDGYWYERIEKMDASDFGFKKMEIGTLTFADRRQLSAAPIYHNLDEIPKCMIIFARKSPYGNHTVAFLAANKDFKLGADSYATASVIGVCSKFVSSSDLEGTNVSMRNVHYIADENSIYMNGTMYYYGGITYNYMLFA